MPQAVQRPDPATPVTSRPPEESAFRDDWYLLPYQAPGQKGLGLWRLLGQMPKSQAKDWPKVLAAFALSAFVGLGAAAFHTTEQATHSSSVTAAPVRHAQTAHAASTAAPEPDQVKLDAHQGVVPPQPVSREEMDRLETRNRRLEALIKVLRQRAEQKNAAHE